MGRGRRQQPAMDKMPGDPGRIRRFSTWFMTARSTKIASLTLLVVLVSCGAYVLLFPDSPDPEPAPSSAGPQAPAVQVDPNIGMIGVTPAAAQCPAADAKQVAPETLVLTSYDTKWVGVHGILLPQSKGAGPRVPDPVRACFSRSPEGALYSAASFYLQGAATATAQDRITLVQARASRTEAYGQVMTQALNDPTVANPDPSAPRLRLSGYIWSGYTPDVAQVDLQFTDPAGTAYVVTARMTWEANDWLVVLSTQGSDRFRRLSNSTVVFTPWGPPA